MYSGALFVGLKVFMAAPPVQAAAFGLPLLMVLVWAPLRWLRRR